MLVLNPDITGFRLTYSPPTLQTPHAVKWERGITLKDTSDAWRTVLLRGRTRVTLAAMHAVRKSFAARERWRAVSLAQFQTYLREYPRSLEERPRVARRSAHREWTDVTLGSWPANAVAQCWTRGRNQGYQIRSV